MWSFDGRKVLMDWNSFYFFAFIFVVTRNFVYICIVMWKEKLGNYFIDVSKYVLTGVVITSFFKDFGESKLTIYGIGTAFAIIILIVGLILTNKKSKKKEDK